MLKRIRRQLDFARGVPPRQIGRRAWLALRRRAERRLRPRLDPGPLCRVDDPPLPLLPPREGLARQMDSVWAFRFIGRELQLPEPIDWRPSGASQLWRMNLHYMEYLESVSDERFTALAAQWIAGNPAYTSGATSDAWNAYALSLRVLVWMQQLAARRLRNAAVEGSLAAQLLYLERHVESDIGGNHLLKNIKALLWASRFFDGQAAKRWRRKGLRLLARELPRQMLADGMHYELSPSYHCQVFADLMEVWHALGGDPLGGALDAALRRSARVVADLAHPDGRVAQFSDSGCSMAYLPQVCIAAFERLFGAAERPRDSFAYPNAGYYGVRDGDSYFVADAGRVAPDSLPAHGHGDALSFEWSLDGQRLVVDQGVFEYVAGPRRTASRSAAFHNTLVLEGGDQADFYGAFRSARRARVRVDCWQTGGGRMLLEAHHDGFSRLSGSPVHRRRFIGSARAMRIEDRVDGFRTAPARVAMLLHPDAAVQQIGAGQLLVTCGRAKAWIRASHDIHVEPAVWWPDMGVENPTHRLVLALPPGDREAWVELAPADQGSGKELS